MNKQLITIAIGAVLAATTGIAAADVSLYGKFNIAVAGGDLNAEDTIDVQAGGSRLGIRAEDDLGNGMTSWIWSEWKMDPADADADTQFANRDTFVGLKGSFGNVYAGNGGTAYKAFTGGFDLFGDTVGDHNASTGAGKFSGIQQPAATNISYSNKVNNIGFAVSHGPENGTEGGETFNHAHVKWSNDSLMIGAAFGSNDADAWAEGQTLTSVGAQWSMDKVKVLGIYEQGSNMGGTDGNDTTVMGLGATFGVGEGTISAQYYTTDYDLADSTTNSFAVGYGMKLSKSTSWAVNYASVDNDAAADTVTGWDVGMSVKF